jgi:formylglycine-generating enzyme required for sulfatase activity
MKVIEELVNYLKSEGLISDANVDWLRAQGLLPGFANSSDASDFDSDLSRDGGDDSSESHSDALDALAEQQTQEGLRRKLGAWKHARKRTSPKSSSGGSSGKSKPHPRRSQAHYEKRLVSEKIQAVESVSRAAAIQSLILCLRSVEASFHGALVETLITIGSQSTDAFIGIVMELQKNGLLEESSSQQIARSILTRSASREQEVLYRTATLYEELYVEQDALGSDGLKWLFHQIFTNSQQERFLETLHALLSQRELHLPELYQPSPLLWLKLAPEPITNSLGMKLIWIPAGTFMMGSPANEKGLSGDEWQHEVTLTQTYYLGMTPVTQSQYQQVMGENPSYFQGTKIKAFSSHHPVENISWDDAAEFCRRLSELPAEKAVGRVYRLPTEAEWEYACRAGSKTAYSFGESSESLGDYAWFDGNSNNQTHPVGEKKANAWGLYDMHGNVWEWCSDWYDGYPEGAVSDPAGPQGGSDRVYRGGCFIGVAALCRSGFRYGRVPSYRFNGLGFRVALSPSGIPK